MKYLTLFVILPALLSQTAGADYIFEEAYDQPLSIPSPVCLAGGDFNNDGFPDFVATYHAYPNSNYLFLFKGNGDCTFDLTSIVSTYTMGSMTMNDFNNDGNLDLLIGEGWVGESTHESDTIHVYEGNGDGTFIEIDILIAENVWVTSGDLNNDGNDDIVIADLDFGGTDIVVVRLGNGDFTFQPATSYSVPQGILHTVQILGDMDLDGNTDIGVINGYGGDGIVFLYGNGDGTFQPAMPVVAFFDGAFNFCFIAPGDFNEDGEPDFVATSGDVIASVDIAYVWDGSQYYDADHFTGAGNWVEVRDFNLDGHLDVALSSDNSGKVFPGYGNGHFPGEWNTDSLLLIADGGNGVLSEDFDLDGDQDLIFFGDTSVECYRNTTITQGCSEESGSTISSELSVRVSPNPFSSSVAIEVSGNSGVDTGIQYSMFQAGLLSSLSLMQVSFLSSGTEDHLQELKYPAVFMQ
ncbi:MAG: VCBS repeat-containing protein [Candidatus Sabulitectum sp.]|nr:VCBS repeat-containing protein [Candidatus Sabulitectum sp.]